MYSMNSRRLLSTLIASTGLLALPLLAQDQDKGLITPSPSALTNAAPGSTNAAPDSTNAAPSVPPPPPLPPAATLNSPWGIASSASSTGTIASWYPKMVDAGITWARVWSPEWSGTEPDQGTWDFTVTDAALLTAQLNGIHVSGMFFGSPKWVDPHSHAFPMQNLDNWSEYAAKMVDRYKDRVHEWEVWNEGNAGFNDAHSTTEDYAKLLSVAYVSAKRSDPTAKIGLSVASFDAPYIGQVALAQARNGKPGQFDFICIHPYETFGGLGDPDGEILYLWMTRLLRDELKADVPGRANVPIWITEIGRPVNRATSEVGMALGKSTTEEDAAHAVVKAYIMALAQGIDRIFWFEGQDPDREQSGYGLLHRDGSPRPGLTAMKTMTGLLGPLPKYQGWLALGQGGKSYGFLFQGLAGPVLVLWLPADTTDNLTFTGDVQVTNSLTGQATPLKAGDSLALSNDPVFVSGVPAALVTQAQANAGKNFPWGGNYSSAKTVSLEYGDTPKMNGIFQTNPNATQLHKFDDGTEGITVKGDIGSPVSFYTHPSFANLQTRDYYIRATFRRIGPGNVGMNFHYEVADSKAQGPMRSNGGWFSVGPDLGWQTHTWHVTDASFSKMWGYDFSFNPEQSVPFAIGKVEVSTQPFAN